MPRGDRTGPLGRGSMTGRQLGRCTDNENREFGLGFGGGGRGRGFFNDFRGSGGGRGFGQGNGMGYGYRARFQSPWDANDIRPETGQASNLEQLDINKRLTEAIDQLSKLIKQSPEIRGTNAEKE